MRADWQHFPPGHLYFLTTFLVPHPADVLPPGVDWRLVLGADPAVITQRFLEGGATTRAGLVDCLAYKYDAAALAQMCGERELPTTGEKTELALRLVQADPDGARAVVGDLILLTCTDNGRIVAEAYLADGCPGLAERGRVPIDKAMRVARWTLEALTTGVLGNLAYDGLRRLAEGLATPPATQPVMPPLPQQPQPQPVPTPRPTAQPGTPEAVPTARGALRFDWVTIPAGPFLMGSDKRKDKQALDEEMLQHTVDLPEYRIARVPVTVAQFAAFIKASGYRTTAELAHVRSTAPGNDWAHPYGPKSDVRSKQDHPVTNVSWHDVVAFCKWAGVRLPTEAEWEKAARGTDGRIWPWGNSQPTEKLCNFGYYVRDTTPVGSYPDGKSPYGLWDMAGNVCEWTSSLYESYPYKSDDGREDVQKVRPRVLRGGSFGDDPRLVRCAYRSFYDPLSWTGYHLFGFRVVSPGF